MADLLKEFKTSIALDESVSRVEDLERIQGWDGYMLIKPLRLGRYKEFLEWREKNTDKIIYSSALESAFGESFGLKIAFSDKKNNFSLGYGVADFFEDQSMSLVKSNPIVKFGDFDLNSLWGKL